MSVLLPKRNKSLNNTNYLKFNSGGEDDKFSKMNL